MLRRALDLIAFDGDDTLWHNERSYREGRERFRRLLANAGVVLSAQEVEAHVNRTDLAKHMLTEEIELFPAATELLTTLAASWPLMLITKGDLLHQTSKLERSGLRDRFRFVEVVSHKTPGVYAAILSRHGVDPNRFL